MSPEDHLRAAFEGLGLLADAESARTPHRVAELLAAFTPATEAPALDPIPSNGCGPVVLRDLPFHSLCVHHLLPFFGTATIGYLPHERIVGLGGIARTLRHFARRPQLQERMGMAIAAHLVACLDTATTGVIVRLRARHLCMEMRGVESTGEVETTSIVVGAFARDHVHGTLQRLLR